VLNGADPAGDALRFTGLVAGTGIVPVVLVVPVLDPPAAAAIGLVALCRGVLPVIVPDQLPAVWPDLPGPVVLAGPPDSQVLGPPTAVRAFPATRPVLRVAVPPLSAAGRRALWQRLLPDCPDAASAVPGGLGVVSATVLARDASVSAMLRDAAVKPA